MFGWDGPPRYLLRCDGEIVSDPGLSTGRPAANNETCYRKVKVITAEDPLTALALYHDGYTLAAGSATGK